MLCRVRGRFACCVDKFWLKQLVDTMNPIDLLFWTAAVVALGFILHGLTDLFSRDARIARKRRRNHGRICTKARRPTVMLSVRTKRT